MLSAPNSQSPEAILAELEVFGVRLGLDSTLRLLKGVGDPQTKYPVVLVAGTNGKGSTSALLASILSAAGYDVGLFTSPHLESVEERIRVAGRCISRKDLGRELATVVATGHRILGHPPTYFEALTVAAYAYFERSGVDVAVMEVGLGGRLDATNAAEPILSLVTSISLDHMHVLGENVDLIAREKAGILRAGVPSLSWVEDAEAMNALQEEAGRRGAQLVDARVGTVWNEIGSYTDGRHWELSTVEARYRFAPLLRGDYQARNIGLAVRAGETLQRRGWAIGIEAIESGVRDCLWPGRCELITLPSGHQVLLEAAHNEEGITLLRRLIQRMWTPEKSSGAPGTSNWTVIFGALDDKPSEEMLRTVAEGAGRVILTAPKTPRATDPAALAPLLEAGRGVVAADTGAALDLALEEESLGIVVCGSIYLVGEMREELRRRYGHPPPATEALTLERGRRPRL